MGSIIIKKNPNGDSRTAPKNITFEQFQEANDMHKSDVAAVMKSLAASIKVRGEIHDYTKKRFEKMFYDDFLATINEGADFVNGEWYQLHINKERHHLLSRCPEGVDLIDVIEMIVDCVCAGKARSGEVRPIELNDEILKKAVENTVKRINNMVVVEED